MKKLIYYILFIICFVGGFIIANLTSHRNICTNNSIRNYKYEEYCDSLWNNPNCYLDSLNETIEYQLYIEAHGGIIINMTNQEKIAFNILKDLSKDLMNNRELTEYEWMRLDWALTISDFRNRFPYCNKRVLEHSINVMHLN